MLMPQARKAELTRPELACLHLHVVWLGPRFVLGGMIDLRGFRSVMVAQLPRDVNDLGSVRAPGHDDSVPA